MSEEHKMHGFDIPEDYTDELKKHLKIQMTRNTEHIELMKGRGYTPYHNLGTFSKRVDNNFIYAEIRQSASGDVVKLSSEPLGHFMTIESGEFQLTHPDFQNFEDRLVRYITACKDADFKKAIAGYKPPFHDKMEEYLHQTNLPEYFPKPVIPKNKNNKDTE